MKEKHLNLGDLVSLKTKNKTWQGHVLESHDSEVILLKLKSGYNIGIRESEVISVQIKEKALNKEKEKPILEKKESLRNIAMIITGGTISSRLDPKTGGVISTDAEEILKIAPEISDICNIVKISSPLMKFSEDMGPKDWKLLAKESQKLLNDDSIDGIIITHGTDTLHYTSAALSFFLKNLNKPVAITYSQRSIDRGSTDAHLNLLAAARYAVSDIAEVALIGHKDTNDSICLAMPATKVRKMHTSIRGTFQIINSEPLAIINKDSIKISDEFNARDSKKSVELDDSFIEDIALIKVNPGMDPDILEHYASKNYKGIILEVTGLGQVPGPKAKYNWLPKIKKIINSGIPIFATAQTINGRLNPNVYSAGRELQKTDIIFLEDMLSETAFVKLGWVLGHKDWDIKEKMLENFSREFSSKLSN